MSTHYWFLPLNVHYLMYVLLTLLCLSDRSLRLRLPWVDRESDHLHLVYVTYWLWLICDCSCYSGLTGSFHLGCYGCASGPCPGIRGSWWGQHWPLSSSDLLTSGFGPCVAYSGAPCTLSMCRFSRGGILGPLPSGQGGLVRSTDLCLVSDPLTLGRRFQGLMLKRLCHYLHLVSKVISGSTFNLFSALSFRPNDIYHHMFNFMTW